MGEAVVFDVTGFFCPTKQSPTARDEVSRVRTGGNILGCQRGGVAIADAPDEVNELVTVMVPCRRSAPTAINGLIEGRKKSFDEGGDGLLVRWTSYQAI